MVKVKGPLAVKSSCERLWGCGTHLALLAYSFRAMWQHDVSRFWCTRAAHGNTVYLPAGVVPIYLLAL